MEVRRVTIELPMPAFTRLEWCKSEIGAGTMVEVIRHALRVYEKHLKAEKCDIGLEAS